MHTFDGSVISRYRHRFARQSPAGTLRSIVDDLMKCAREPGPVRDFMTALPAQWNRQTAVGTHIVAETLRFDWERKHASGSPIETRIIEELALAVADDALAMLRDLEANPMRLHPGEAKALLITIADCDLVLQALHPQADMVRERTINEIKRKLNSSWGTDFPEEFRLADGLWAHAFFEDARRLGVLRAMHGLNEAGLYGTLPDDDWERLQFGSETGRSPHNKEDLLRTMLNELRTRVLLWQDGYVTAQDIDADLQACRGLLHKVKMEVPKPELLHMAGYSTENAQQLFALISAQAHYDDMLQGTSHGLETYLDPWQLLEDLRTAVSRGTAVGTLDALVTGLKAAGFANARADIKAYDAAVQKGEDSTLRVLAKRVISAVTKGNEVKPKMHQFCQALYHVSQNHCRRQRMFEEGGLISKNEALPLERIERQTDKLFAELFAALSSHERHTLMQMELPGVLVRQRERIERGTQRGMRFEMQL